MLILGPHRNGTCLLLMPLYTSFAFHCPLTRTAVPNDLSLFLSLPLDLKASGRELSFILLTGILICYLNTFTLLAKPMLASCAIQRLSVGTGFSIVYGALFTKTNRISRIFDSVKP